MPRMTLCNECGVIVSAGWGLHNHMRKFHTAGEDQRGAEELHDMNDDAHPNEDDNEDMDNEDWEHNPAIEEYLAGLQAAVPLISTLS